MASNLYVLNTIAKLRRMIFDNFVGNAFASGRIDQTLAEILIVLIPNVDIDWTTLIILGQLVSVHSL